jgi:hypothetical protein
MTRRLPCNDAVADHDERHVMPTMRTEALSSSRIRRTMDRRLRFRCATRRWARRGRGVVLRVKEERSSVIRRAVREIGDERFVELTETEQVEQTRRPRRSCGFRPVAQECRGCARQGRRPAPRARPGPLADRESGNARRLERPAQTQRRAGPVTPPDRRAEDLNRAPVRHEPAHRSSAPTRRRRSH